MSTKNKGRNNKPTIPSGPKIKKVPASPYQGVKLAVAVPCGAMVHTQFCMSLVSMVALSGKNRLDIILINTQSSVGPQKARFEAVVEAKKFGATHILFVDSDQVFPPQTALQLLQHKKPIVGCVIPQRVAPFGLNARIKGKRVRIHASDQGLLPVQTLGTGIMLIDMKVFDKLEAPYFNVRFENGEWTREDESFCLQAGLVGHGVFADVDLSRVVGHLGEQPVTLQHAKAYAEQLDAMEAAKKKAEQPEQEEKKIITA